MKTWTCEECNKIFELPYPRKFCDDCKLSTTQWDAEKCWEAAGTCKDAMEFNKKFIGGYEWAVRNNIWESIKSEVFGSISELPVPRVPNNSGYKTCGKCNETKKIDEFGRRASNRDGLRYRCKICERQYALSKMSNCIGCGGYFNPKTNENVCFKCSTCKYTKEHCQLAMNQCDSLIEFKDRFPGEHGKSAKNGWISEFGGHLSKYRNIWTYDDAVETIKKYTDFKLFVTEESGLYQWLCRNNLLEELTPEIPRNRSKYYATTLYFIRCTGNNEIFYKIGITKNSVKKRYATKMPYEYEIIWTIDDVAQICNFESKIIKDYSKYKYIPKIKFGGYTECFQFHGNCKILRGFTLE